ncbi:DUF3048 domain-containing protein [Flexivirga oryzae]|uniref:DUF3048 domain-containing protein n=1 Tax=Flexivirga oryzae TaxID=1794944 RepID=A0A839N4I2_9MICO|nr:DUF3048 domain-containing protein [Flexivirga oryzae]MBB2891659.1 hypothetical protein [Flexivirga oryzae]
MRNNTRRRVVTVGVAATALVLAACSSSGSGAASVSSPMSTPGTASTTPRTTAPKATAPTSSAPAARRDPLTGLARNGNPVIAVKLENTAAAMPQFGLSAADLVFVEEVEGSLTRLMPVYQSRFPRRVEPVRSVRSTDIDLLPMFGKPLLVYSGVASQVRPKLSNASITLDSQGTRDPGRVAPHNLYFDLAALSKRKGLPTSRDIGLRFGSATRLKTATRETQFTVQIGGDRFSFSYKANRYLPSWNGRAYTDSGAGGQQVTASNVLVLKTRTVSDGYKDPAGTPVYKTVSVGKGSLTLYRDGRRVTGTWDRTAKNNPFRLRDDRGRQLQLARGKTWILLQS